MRNPLLTIIALLGLSVGILFISSASSVAQNPTVGVEIWGGDHVELQLDHNGGELTFDCATGHLNQPLKPDRRGRFTVKGTYTPEYHGPVRDDINLTRPAVYTGTIRTGAMTLEIQQEGAQNQTYSLTRGRGGALTRCQ